MGDNTTSSTQTTTQTLPANQQRNVDVLLRGALDYFNSGGRTFFPGDVVADFDPLQLAGQGQLVNFAGGVGTDLASDTINANRRLLDPTILDPSQNPIYTNVIGDLLTRNTQNFQEQVLPSIRTDPIANRTLGGSAENISTALATDRFLQNQREQQNAIALGQQGLGLNAMLNAIRSAPGSFQLGVRPGEIVSGVGGVRQNQAQNEIQGEVARHEFEQNEPIAILELLRNLTGQAGTFGGTTETTSEQTTESSPINQVLGGAMLAASLYNPMTSLFSRLAPTNAIPGLGGFAVNPFSGMDNFNPFANMALTGP